MKITRTRSMRGFQNLASNAKVIMDNQLYVGIPQDNFERPGNQKATNAELLFIQSKGSPKRNIPARPIIEPSIEESKDKLKILTDRAIKAAMEGKKYKALDKLKEVGLQAVSEIRNFVRKFPDNGLAPNKPSTIRRKKRNKPSGYTPIPLVDTNEMVKSITYVIISKSGRKVGKIK